MTHRFLCTTFLTGAICALPHLAEAQVWTEINKETNKTTLKTQSKKPSTQVSAPMPWARKVNTDKGALTFLLSKAPIESADVSDITIDLPLPDGGVGTFTLVKSPIIEQGLSAKRPNIQTFRVVDTKNPYNTGRLDLTSRGFNGLFRYNGELVFLNQNDDQSFYSFFESDYNALKEEDNHEDSACGFDDLAETLNYTPITKTKNDWDTAQKFSVEGGFREYRIAVAATGEYTQAFGGTKEDGLSGIITAINRLNVFYETDLAVRFTVVANNEDVVFTDPDTDPFSNSSNGDILGEISDVLETNIGFANYDIGHVFTTIGGGVASIQSVCRDSQKSRGVSGSGRSLSGSSFLNILAHEIGHQFGARHTFNGNTRSCGGGQRSTVSNIEPHSGSTFMSYSGTCGEENLSGGRGQFFHNFSLTQMNDFIDDTSRGGSCIVPVSFTNAAPNVDAGEPGTIPISTPFTLTGNVTDADGDAMAHIWEQVDSGTPNENASDFADEGTRALFRSFLPNESQSRTFPQIERVLDGDRVLGEVLPSTDRDLTFRLTSRDGKGGVADDERIISVTTAAGPFTIETPSATTVDGGLEQTVTWDVANTADAPVSCANVRLSLSTDGGQTFDSELTPSTANDGSAVVEFPNITTTSARLKASCLTQPFFAINEANFAITQTVIVNDPPLAVADTATVEEDSRRTAINVLSNDSDPEGDTLTLSSVGTPNQGGSVTISGATILYTPFVGFVGTESFDYTISDGNDNSATTTVTMNVTAKPNTPPSLQDDTETIEEGSDAVLINVLANDTDADGDSLTLQSLGTPSNGANISIEGTRVSYRPADAFSGEETFTYTVSDGEGATETATVTIIVTPRPNIPPVITEETFSVEVDQDASTTLINILANVTDADGDTLTIIALGTPSAGGTAIIQDNQIAYTPAAGYSGQETLTYTVSDGEGGEQSGTVSITVTAAPAPPPPPSVDPASSSPSSGGGGSFGPFLLLLLAIRNRVVRRRKASIDP